MFDDLHEVIDQRNALHQQIIKSLAHLNREDAMNIIMSWMSLDELRGIIPTICKHPPVA